MTKRITLIMALLITIICGAQGAVVVTETEELLNQAIGTNDDIRLDADIALKESVTITEGKDLTIDLNGHTLSCSTGNVISVENGGKLTLKDSSEGKTGTISGAKPNTFYGGGIINKGTLIVQGCNITNCKAALAGGGIFNEANCTMTLTDVTIQKSEAPDGAAIFNRGTINMTGCTITENSHSNTTGGGCISNQAGATLSINGGSITHNMSNNGAAIWSKGTLNMKGVITITGNLSGNTTGVYADGGTASDLYLVDGAVVTVTGPLNDGTKESKIGISAEQMGVITSGYKAMTGATTVKYFFADGTGNKLTADEELSIQKIETDGKSWLDFKGENMPRYENGVLYIESAEDLAWLAYEYKDSHLIYYDTGDIVQTVDIDLSAHDWFPIGTYDTPFRGKYNGGGHIISGMKCSGEDYLGLFGKVGILTGGYVEGSVSDVVLLNSEVSGRNYVGGICGYALGHIMRCVTDTKVSGNSSVGGIIGENGYLDFISEVYELPDTYYNPNIQDCLYTGSSVTATESTRGAIIGNFTHTNGWEGVIKNNYFTNGVMSKLNNVLGLQAFPIYTTTPGLMLSFNSEPKGVEYESVRYIPKTGAKVTVEAVDANNTPAEVKLNGRTLGTGAGTYDIALQDGESEAVITSEVTMKTLEGEGTEESPYLIKTTEDWITLAAQVYSGNTYRGKHLRLENDITVTTMVGKSDVALEGSFNGNGHTLTFNAGTAEKPVIDEYVAPFRYYAGSSIYNLSVAGTIYTASRYAGGIIAQLKSDATLDGCRSSVAIHSTYEGNAFHGGLIAERDYDYNSIVFNCCVFDGELQGEKSAWCAGFVGYAELGDFDASFNAQFSDCLFAPKAITMKTPSNFTYYESGFPNSFINCYYTDTKNEKPQGKKANVYNDYISAFGSITERQNHFMEVYEHAIKFDGKWYSPIVTLANAESNAEKLGTLNGQTADVCLLDRTLYKDGSWNTLCLPFAVADIEQTPLAGATVKTLDNSSFNSKGTLTLNFSGNLTALEAGKPYIVTWESGGDVISPVFDGVTVSSATTNVETANVDFMGTFSPVSLAANDHTVLYMGADNKLYYPSVALSINAFRAYFQLKGITMGDTPQGANNIVLNFDGESTGIADLTPDTEGEDGGYYTIDGRQQNGVPTQKGIFIHNGKKVVVK